MTKEEQLRKVFFKIVLDIMDDTLTEEQRRENAMIGKDFLIDEYVDKKVHELLTEVKIRTEI